MITGIWYGPIMCKVDSATRVYPGGIDDGLDRGKWVYALTSMEWGEEFPFPSTAQAEPGYVTGSAFNLWELNNDETTQYGITVANLPGGFELKPVPVGAYVMAYNTNSKTDPQGFTLTVFTYPNQFDGDC
tara:strand:+ start:3699 stop:4088 length:390 start_codon:yes stop_codon:yes gene_type:complete